MYTYICIHPTCTCTYVYVHVDLYIYMHTPYTHMYTCIHLICTCIYAYTPHTLSASAGRAQSARQGKHDGRVRERRVSSILSCSAWKKRRKKRKKKKHQSVIGWPHSTLCHVRKKIWEKKMGGRVAVFYPVPRGKKNQWKPNEWWESSVFILECKCYVLSWNRK